MITIFPSARTLLALMVSLDIVKELDTGTENGVDAALELGMDTAGKCLIRGDETCCTCVDL